MRIVDIRERAVPLKSEIRNSSFDFSEMTTSVVAVLTDVVREGTRIAGFAFNSTGRYACGAAMRARFVPRILAADPATLLDETGENFDPGKILGVMMQREKAGGHSERSIAIGTIEVAVWDAIAKIAGKPLHRVLAERYNGGRIAGRVFCYVGGGWYFPGQSLRDLQDEMRRHLEAGYTMLKMKVGGLSLAEDLRRVEAVKSMLPADSQLAVDANSKFGRDEALAYAEALAPFELRWFEEPCDPLDFALLAEIASMYEPPLSTGENLFSTQDVQNLVRFGGLRPDRGDVIQVDPPQSYGIVTYARTIDMLAQQGWPRTALFPHGGNQMSVAIAAGFGLGGAEAYPGVFGAFGGFADDAAVQDGYLTLSERPGIGFEAQSALYAIMREMVT
jgi:L-alanine-DL-glutamate epimerase-like enolase superfamily enzyme